jgi:hypothetical protein
MSVSEIGVITPPMVAWPGEIEKKAKSEDEKAAAPTEKLPSPIPIDSQDMQQLICRLAFGTFKNVSNKDKGFNASLNVLKIHEDILELEKACKFSKDPGLAENLVFLQKKLFEKLKKEFAYRHYFHFGYFIPHIPSSIIKQDPRASICESSSFDFHKKLKMLGDFLPDYTIDHEVDWNADNWTPKHDQYHMNPQVAELLLRETTNQKIKNMALWYWSTNINPALRLMSLALDIGANPNFCFQGKSPMHHCRDETLLKKMIEKGGNINLIPGAGERTPLTSAMYYNSPRRALMLLAAGANPCLPDGTGQTPGEYLHKISNSDAANRILNVILDASEKQGQTNASCKCTIM